MTQEERGGDSIELRVLWRSTDSVPILLANQFVAQTEQDEIILTVGQFQPPILLGTAEEKFQQAQQLGYLAVQTVARLALTRTRLGELIAVLEDHARKYDDTHHGR